MLGSCADAAIAAAGADPPRTAPEFVTWSCYVNPHRGTFPDCPAAPTGRHAVTFKSEEMVTPRFRKTCSFKKHCTMGDTTAHVSCNDMMDKYYYDVELEAAREERALRKLRRERPNRYI
eukprot:UN10687